MLMAAYHEVGNVEELALRFAKVFTSLQVSYEMLFVLQGDDGAKEGLLDLKKKGHPIRIVHYPKAIGVGPAFRKGFSVVTPVATHVLTLDADLNHQPEEVDRFVSRMRRGDVDVVIGSRLVKGGSMIYRGWLKESVSHLVNFIGPAAFRIPAKDITSGYRLWKKESLDAVWRKTKARNFEFYPELLLFAARQGSRMAEVPINFRPRTRGKSKMSFATSGWGYCKLFARTLFAR